MSDEKTTTKHAPVLISRAQLGLTMLTGDDEYAPPMQAIHVTPTYAEATNGRALLRVPHDELPVAEFPDCDGKGKDLDESMLVLPNTLDKAFKNTDNRSSLPILAYVHLGQDEKGNVVASATDLETSVNIRQRKIEGKFPDTASLMNEPRKPYCFTLSAQVLQDVVSWACKYGDKKIAGIRFFADESTKSIQIEITSQDVHHVIASGLIMPIRDTHALQRPDVEQASEEWLKREMIDAWGAAEAREKRSEDVAA